MDALGVGDAKVAGGGGDAKGGVEAGGGKGAGDGKNAKGGRDAEDARDARDAEMAGGVGIATEGTKLEVESNKETGVEISEDWKSMWLFAQSINISRTQSYSIVLHSRIVGLLLPTPIF